MKCVAILLGQVNTIFRRDTVHKYKVNWQRLEVRPLGLEKGVKSFIPFVGKFSGSPIGFGPPTRLVVPKTIASKLFPDLLCNATHITEVFVLREISPHDPTTMDPCSQSEWQFDNRNRTLGNGCGVQDHDLSEQFVSPVRNGNQVSISLGG